MRSRTPTLIFVALAAMAASCGGSARSGDGTGGDVPVDGAKKDGSVLIPDFGSKDGLYKDGTPPGQDGTTGQDGTAGQDGSTDGTVKPDGMGPDMAKTDAPDSGKPCGTGIVKGMICDPDKKEFVKGAKVSIETKDCAGMPETLTATTDAQGFFVIDGVPDGPQELIVEWGGTKLLYAILVVADQVNDVSPATMAGCEGTDRCYFGDVKGLLCWKAGMPGVPVTKVSVTAVDCDGNPVYVETTTDAKGGFVLLKVPEGKQTVVVENAKVKEQYEVDVPPDAMIDAGLLGPADCGCHFGNVRGQVCWKAGMEGVGDTKAFIDTVDCEGSKVWVETKTDEQGFFKLMGVPEGKQVVHIKNSKTDVTYPVTVVKDQMNEMGFVGPTKCECQYGDLKGKLCWTAGMPGAPFTKVFIETVNCFGEKIYLETFVDGAGYFTFTGVPSGQQVVHVENAKTNATYTVTVSANQLNDVGLLGPAKCCGAGTVCGYACAPSGSWVGGVHVWIQTIDCSGAPVKIETYTDSNGNYCLDDVPDGNQLVHVEKGQFSTQYTIPVKAGQTVKAQDIISDQELCFPKAKVKIAVVTGEWDAIQQILDKLGFAYDLYDGMFNYEQTVSFLANLNKMKEYDIIFFNCGASHDYIIGSNGAITSNLQKYVQGGGAIYASDWAYVYVDFPFPAFIDYAGKIGNSGTRTGTVVDASLVQALGKNSVVINFNLGAWVVVQGVNGQTTKHITGPTQEVGGTAPWMMSFTPFAGGGRVLYTTFHNEFQATQDMQKILEALVFIF